MRRSALFLAPVIALCAAGPSMADGRIIQIEPRPTYGATVSIEAGVRVFRPLPAGPRTVIVNPGRTPLALDVGDNRVVNQTNTSTNVFVKRRSY